MGQSIFQYTVNALAAMGHRPAKKFGQNFLVDMNVVEKFVRFAGLEEGDNVVEIGPGLATVSREILRYGAKLFAIELDGRLFQFLRDTCGGNKNFNLMRGDAVEFPIAALDETCTNYKIVASLPYAISSPWLESLLECAHLPQSISLIIQLDAANRFLAPHGTKSFGPMSIFLQSAYRKVAAHKISRNSFYPIPGVDSTMIFLAKKEAPFLFSRETKRKIRDIFTNRRKQMGKVSRGHGPSVESWLNGNKIPPSARPEQIPLEAWQDFQVVTTFSSCRWPEMNKFL
ncbi:MAG: 16S rRNA (adenine(1518)-N(6)/adenine(1519)-N(6))-dimethyltransferase RsmA [Puniceicoccales bacterium]|jgi:16S rRNA (adenine1518-N6/adenine1519-N6)-dimethyltransferase|nr:16S rRNA (adenine(1518)-N(6)/adenine(1519)-N(6))-dimethyltransferase RsmA [Puniceicoccales bacterium]